MEITYNFANGENVIVLVDEKLGSTIMQLSKDLYNNNHKETRRHQNLNEVLEKNNMVVDENVNIEEEFLKQNDVDKLHKAISKLKSSEQELIHKLYLSKNSMTQAEYAKGHNISYTTLRKRLERLRQKLKSTIQHQHKFFKKNMSHLPTPVAYGGTFFEIKSRK